MSCKNVGVEIRPANSDTLVGATWLLLALMGATQLYANGTQALRVVPLLVGMGVLAWRVLKHPSLRLDEHALILVNPFNQVTIPWSAVIDMDVKFGLRVVTPHGRHAAWGAPGRSNFGRNGTATDAERARGHWQAMVEAQAIEVGIADDVPVTRTWDVAAIVLCFLLVSVGLAVALV